MPIPACESACLCSSMANRPHYKSFKFIDNSQDVTRLKWDKRTSLELDRHRGEAVAMNQPRANYTCLASENPVHEAEIPTSPSELEDGNGRRKIHIKSSLVDSDMPEMVAFFQDSNYHLVKDIFIDREVHFRDEYCSIKNCELDHNVISSILDLDVESNSVSTIETADTRSSISNESRLIAEDDCRNDVINQQDSRILTKKKEDVDDQDDVLVEKILHGAQLAKEVPSTEAVDCNVVTITSTTEASIKDSNSRQTLETKSSSRPEDRMSESATSSSPSLVNENVQGESSSMEVESALRQPEYSGLESCCGSVSLGSSGSNASSHSFAFPIMPSEWIGSPERMATVDQRQSRRQQHWRKRFLCCKF